MTWDRPLDSEPPPADSSTHDSSETSNASPRSEKGTAEFIRRLLEAGFEKWAERPELRQKLADLKLPKDTWNAVLSQLDDGKSGLYRALSKELRDFLQSTNFAEDLVRALTKLSFEIRTEIRFIPNDSGLVKPDFQTKVDLKSDPHPTSKKDLKKESSE